MHSVRPINVGPGAGYDISENVKNFVKWTIDNSINSTISYTGPVGCRGEGGPDTYKVPRDESVFTAKLIVLEDKLEQLRQALPPDAAKYWKETANEYAAPQPFMLEFTKYWYKTTMGYHVKDELFSLIEPLAHKMGMTIKEFCQLDICDKYTNEDDVNWLMTSIEHKNENNHHRYLGDVDRSVLTDLYTVWVTVRLDHLEDNVEVIKEVLTVLKQYTFNLDGDISSHLKYDQHTWVRNDPEDV